VLYCAEVTRTLKDFESVAKGLQGGDSNRVSRYAARRAFDDLLDVHDSIERPLHHLRRDANIVNNKHFENAICKIQGHAEADLTNLEKAAVQMFKLPIAPGAVAGGAAINPEPEGTLSFFEKSQKESQSMKRSRVEKSKYRSTEHVSSTSNVCERLFSVAKLVMSDLRKHMEPDTLNMILFLKANKQLWADKTIIDEIIADFAASDEPDE